MLGTPDAMVAEAEKSLGTKESPPGSNSNYIVTWYNKNVARIGKGPWCDMSISMWASKSGNAKAVGLFAYTPWHAADFKSRGRWHKGTKGIRRGDIVFYDWGGSKSISRIDHVGLVTSVKNGKIHTIEGNRGDRCDRFIADPRFVAGYGRPNYKAVQQSKEEDMPSAISLQATGQAVEKGKPCWIWWNKENDDSGKQHSGSNPGILTNAKFAMLHYCVHGVDGVFYAVAHNMKTKKDRLLGTSEVKSGSVDLALGAVYSNEHVYVKFIPAESGTVRAWVRGGYWK